MEDWLAGASSICKLTVAAADPDLNPVSGLRSPDVHPPASLVVCQSDGSILNSGVSGRARVFRLFCSHEIAL